MPRNVKKFVPLLLPVGCFLLAVGWFMYYFGSKKCPPKKVRVARKVGDDLHFGVLLPQEQLAGPAVVQVKNKASRFQWLRNLARI